MARKAAQSRLRAASSAGSDSWSSASKGVTVPCHVPDAYYPLSIPAYTASSTSIGSLIAAEFREGGAKRYQERLADPETKAKMVAEIG